MPIGLPRKRNKRENLVHKMTVNSRYGGERFFRSLPAVFFCLSAHTGAKNTGNIYSLKIVKKFIENHCKTTEKML